MKHAVALLDESHQLMGWHVEVWQWRAISDLTPIASRDALVAWIAGGAKCEQATLADFAHHLSTIFPEVRLRRYLEMRGADAGPRPFLAALPAFFTGLLYEPSSLDAAFDLVKGWSAVARESLRNDVPRLGLAATIDGLGLREVAAEVLHIARAGLAKRNRRDGRGFNETIFLAPLDAVLADGAEAERLIKKFKTKWAGSIAPCFEECAY
jgi:glutamate--cysteine ligase